MSLIRSFNYLLIYIVYNKVCVKLTMCIRFINPLNTELYPICHLLALLGAHHIFHVSGLRVNVL